MAKKDKKEAEVLLYADSESNADMYYMGRVFVPDPFIAFTHNGQRLAVTNRLEYARVKRESIFDDVLSLEDWVGEVRKQKKAQVKYPADVILAIAKAYKISRFKIPYNFPAGIAFTLKELGVSLDTVDGMIFPDREFKTDEESKWIKQGNDASRAGFRVVEKMLRESKIRNGYLYLNGKRLTSEMVQKAVQIACIEKGGTSSNTIVAGGNQACDPHCRGFGPLKAHQLIIVDIFPRVNKTGYHGDMTRTYLKGRATEAQKSLVETVFNAEQWALGEHRTGKNARKIFEDVVSRFEKAGYRTGKENGVPVGFIHGLGHGLGLEVHEPPRVNPQGKRLKKNQVVTVEPGLYYPGLGGCRFEDVIRVQSNTPEMLSRHPYRWHIR